MLSCLLSVATNDDVNCHAHAFGSTRHHFCLNFVLIRFFLSIWQTAQEREKFKEELAQKLIDKDPSVRLMQPEKSSKSYAWLADCFLMIYYNDAKQNFVYCKVCNNLITYNSIHGTGSLLRHNCYRRRVNALSDDASVADGGIHAKMAIKKIMVSLPKMSSKAEQSRTIVHTIGGKSDANSTIFGTKCDLSRHKKDIQEMITREDPSIELKSPANIKSEVWNNGNFRIIYKDGQKLEFVLCLYCNSLITYRSKTGTASLLRHSCTKRLFNQVKMEQHQQSLKEAIIDDDDSPQEIETIPVAEIDQNDEPYESSVDVGSTSYENVVMSSEYPDEFKDEALRLLQCFAFKDMQPGNLLQKKGFLSFGQYLINIGAEYGKVNIENIFADESWWAAQFEEYKKLSGILKKMLKNKFEDQKFALSCDYWTDPNRKTNFLTLYGHHIDEQFEIKKVNLGTVSFTADFAIIDYKQLIISILENYFGNEVEAELFLAKTTIVIFDEMSDLFKGYSTIQCSCLALNGIAQQLIVESNGSRFVPSDIMASDNWSNVWDYLESDVANAESKALLQMLDPFTEASKSLSNDQKPTINEVYIFRKKLIDQFKNANIVASEHIRNVAQTLIEQLFPISNVHQIAVFLDPRFKSLKFMDHEEKSNVIKMVSKMISATEEGGGDETNSQRNPFGANSSQLSNCADSSKYLLEYMDISEDVNDKHEEIDVYINMKLSDVYSANILEFWESRYDLPNLRQLAKEILCIPAAAVVSEKIFSDDANLFVRRRLNMEIDNIKQMLYIHENFDMLSHVL